jgi:hypothetical protein
VGIYGVGGGAFRATCPSQKPWTPGFGGKMDRNLRILAILDSVAEVSKVFVFFLLCPRPPRESSIPCCSVREAVLEAQVCHRVSK